MKTIFIPITSGIAAKNILRTGIIELLTKKGVRPIIIVPPGLKEEFSQEFLAENIIIENYQKPKLIERKLTTLRYLESFNSPTSSLRTNTIRIKALRLKKQNPLRFYFSLISSRLFSETFLSKIIEKINWYIFKKEWCKNLFQKYSPNLLFSTDIYNMDELYLIEYAKRKKIPIIASILSWDNLTSYGLLPIKADKLIVWNEIMKKEAIDFHGYKSEDIYVCGNPLFDLYLNLKFSPKEEFFRKLGLDLNKKLITYTTAPQSICDKEDEIIEIILEAINQGKFDHPSQLLVRPHPKDEIKQYQKFFGENNFFFDRPSHRNISFQDKWNPNKKDILHLAATLKYSDVIINVASTITIEAAIFDRPIINIAFDGYKNKPYLESTQKYYDCDHYYNIVKTRGIKIAKTNEELFKYINQYLNNPGLDQAGRKRIVQKQCWKLDGNTSLRIAKLLLENYEKV